MKTILVSLLWFMPTLCAIASPHTWTFGDGTTLRLELPEGVVSDQVSPPSDTVIQAFTLRYPDVGNQSTISYQFVVTKSGASTDWSTTEKVDEFLMRAGQRGLQGSVEKELKPVHLKMKHGVGSYLVFTDVDLVGKAVSGSGVFKQMTMVACGVGNYTIFVRGYTNSTTEAYFTQMHHVIEGAEILPK